VFIALLIIISQLAWFGIVRVFLIPSLRGNRASPIVSALITARTALQILPAAQRQSFLDKVNENNNFQIVAGDSNQAPEDLSDEVPGDLKNLTGRGVRQGHPG